MTETYYIIAEKDGRPPNESHSSEWPKLVAFSFCSKKILLQEGFGHGLMGGVLSLFGFNASQWVDIFAETDSEWFMRNILDGSVEKMVREKEFEDFLVNNGCKLKTIEY